MEQDQRDKFITYISHKLSLSTDEVLSLRSWSGSNTLGAISLKLNLLDIDEINTLLEDQEETGRRFGDLAIEYGYLNENQINHLLEIQKGNRRAEILQYLLVSEKIDFDEYFKLIGRVYLI